MGRPFDETLNIIGMDQIEFGKRLQSVRKHLKWSQQEVAEKIGSTQLGISRIERGVNVTFSSVSPLLELYSKYISLNVLYAEKFPKNIEDAFWENRIEVPQDYVKKLISIMIKQHKDINSFMDYMKTEFKAKLDETINLL